ncbi:MAG: CRISPR-associated DxTHG motif protein [Verrucomicrobia bacterium]|jgi:hypothetical protein|nr:CRISPR-associated DxTHG motif protein [Verrucomicrobiota bacterium]
MKFFITTLAIAILFVSSLQAQDSPAAASENEAPDIPTEVSEPPYSVGDLVVEQGYYLDRGEGETRINLRLVENKFRLYWIDENGLIAEPEAEKAVVRRIGSVRGRNLLSLSPLPEGTGLGAPTLIFPPHTFNLVLHIPEAVDRPELTHGFRYMPSMDVAVDPSTK